MTSTLLPKLIAASIVDVGDRVSFKYKRNRFSAHVTTGGLLTNCAIDGHSLAGVHKDLQTWCDECIAEHGAEYVQRFSSAKRVKHERTGRTFAQLKELMHTKDDCNQGCQCAASVAQSRRVLELEARVRELEALVPTTVVEDVHMHDNPFVLKF